MPLDIIKDRLKVRNADNEFVNGLAIPVGQITGNYEELQNLPTYDNEEIKGDMSNVLQRKVFKDLKAIDGRTRITFDDLEANQDYIVAQEDLVLVGNYASFDLSINDTLKKSDGETEGDVWLTISSGYSHWSLEKSGTQLEWDNGFAPSFYMIAEEIEFDKNKSFIFSNGFVVEEGKVTPRVLPNSDSYMFSKNTMLISKGTLENIKLKSTDSFDDADDVSIPTTLAVKNFGNQIKSEVEMAKTPNVIIIGNPTINNGQVSDFSTTDYLQYPTMVDFENKTFEIDFSITTQQTGVRQSILGSSYGLAFLINANNQFEIYCKFKDSTTSATSWDISKSSTFTVVNNRTYYIQIVWNKTTYKVNISEEPSQGYQTIIIIDGNDGIRELAPKQMLIGINSLLQNPFQGIINLNDAKLIKNNVLEWQGMDSVGIATRMARDVSNIDETGILRVRDIAETDIKQNKTTFNAPTDEANTLVDNNIAPLGTLTENTTVTIPANIQQGYITGFTFNEPSTLKTLTINYASSGASKFSMIGTDCADGLFTPVVNKHYDVTLYYDGYLLQGVVSGVVV